MNRIGPDYFERLYGEHPDPWGFATRWYERRKYDLTLAALPRAHYRSAFEPGCANGVLTERLAERCEALLAIDLLPAVADRARDRVGHLPGVDVRSAAVPEDWPPGPFDLVVLSEVAYYFTAGGLALALTHVERTLERDGHLLSVHWRGQTDYPLEAETVHRMIDEQPWLRRLVAHEDEEFLLHVHERT